MNLNFYFYNSLNTKVFTRYSTWVLVPPKNFFLNLDLNKKYEGAKVHEIIKTQITCLSPDFELKFSIFLPRKGSAKPLLLNLYHIFQ
jgi:hypothetical protein